MIPEMKQSRLLLLRLLVFSLRLQELSVEGETSAIVRQLLLETDWRLPSLWSDRTKEACRIIKRESVLLGILENLLTCY